MAVANRGADYWAVRNKIEPDCSMKHAAKGTFYDVLQQIGKRQLVATLLICALHQLPALRLLSDPSQAKGSAHDVTLQSVRAGKSAGNAHFKAGRLQAAIECWWGTLQDLQHWQAGGAMHTSVLELCLRTNAAGYAQV